MEKWTDLQGNTFKAEPAEVIGPLALFRLPDRSGRKVLLSQLSPQDCVRFAEQIRALPVPAADWAQSSTKIGSEIYGCARRVQGERLIAAELKGVHEPRFYVLCFANNGESKSWDMLGKIGWPFQEVKKGHPAVVEGFMFGVKHSGLDHTKMATQMKVPFLVSSFEDQPKMSSIMKIVPSANYGVVVCNCNGVPLFFSKGDSEESAKAIMADLDGFLDLLSLSNPRTWADRLHYWKAAQPVLHAADKCDPMLVGDPLNAAKLVQLSVKRFDATLYVSAEGVVTAVSMAAGGDVPEDMVTPITTALHQAQFVPAVDSGTFVAGKFHYRFAAE